MDEVEIFNKMNQIVESPQLDLLFEDNERAQKIAEHRAWLRSIRHEVPSTAKHYKVGIYIRYFNQTKYDNYLYYHKKQFSDTMALCPNWEFVGFYIDTGSNAPNMENAPEWSRLIQDCFDGKVDLIITQKISNVTKKMHEIIFLSRILAALPHPVGIYFISEDLFTTATYYREDLDDTFSLSTYNKLSAEGFREAKDICTEEKEMSFLPFMDIEDIFDLEDSFDDKDV